MSNRYYLTSGDAWSAMLDDCRNAKRSIDFEQYIFIQGGVGDEFLALFREKARQGVRIRLLFDAVGSFSLYNSPHANALRRENIEIAFFNPISPWRVNNFSSWFFRDHRKISVIDGSIGYTGGVCVDERMRAWRDSHVRVEGRVVEEMQYAFDTMWATVGEGKFLRFRKKRMAPTEQGESFLVNSPHLRQRFVYRAYLSALRRAERSIYLVTPYFVPSVRFFSLLQRKARQGVDVRLVVPRASDVKIVDAATKSYFGMALKAGIKIFLYHARPLHAKTAVVDGTWATIGSSNLDNMSFLLNYEGNLISTDPACATEVERQFLEDMGNSHRVIPGVWRKRALSSRIFEAITWPLHEFL